jgi:predicted RNA-binding Zn ribbon-like protein
VRPARFELIAGHLALDFINTVDWRADPARRHDLVGSADDLVAWARLVGIVTTAEARTLKTAAARAPRAGARVLRRARLLREVLARVFEAVGRGARPSARDDRLLNAFLSAALRRRRLELRGASYHWVWRYPDDADFDRVVFPMVLAAAELLASPERLKVRTCAASDCGWLFLDTSRNGARRWCTMQSCGNRAKARRFYQRATASAPQA